MEETALMGATALGQVEILQRISDMGYEEFVEGMVDE